MAEPSAPDLHGAPVRSTGDPSGDGFVTLADGSVRWGRYGAAGVLVRHVAPDGRASYFVARRSPTIHLGGGTWAIPGGAINRDESPLEGALREFSEEMGQPLGEHRVVLVHRDDRESWSYWTHLVEVPRRFAVPTALNWENDAAQWVEVTELASLDLLGAFRSTLVELGILEPEGP